MSRMTAAARLGVSQQLLDKIARGEAPVSVRTALRLERLFSTSAEMWLRLQDNWDLWHARRELERDLAKIKPVKVTWR